MCKDIAETIRADMPIDGPSRLDTGRLWGFILLAVAIASIPNVIWVLWDMFHASK